MIFIGSMNDIISLLRKESKSHREYISLIGVPSSIIKYENRSNENDDSILLEEKKKKKEQRASDRLQREMRKILFGCCCSVSTLRTRRGREEKKKMKSREGEEKHADVKHIHDF